MNAAALHDGTSARLLTVDADGRTRCLPRTALSTLFRPGDLVVANDAATLPASLRGTHGPTGETIEVRLAAWVSPGDPTRFAAIVFGEGDHHRRTEDRPPPPLLSTGDLLALGPLAAMVERTLDHPRLIELRFRGNRDAIFAGLARHGRPIQYAHQPEPLELWDVWTSIAAAPIAFEPPSAGFAVDWRTIAAWRRRRIGFATFTHAAGVSSTGDAGLDARLPFDEPYLIPATTAEAIARVKPQGGRTAVGYETRRHPLPTQIGLARSEHRGAEVGPARLRVERPRSAPRRNAGEGAELQPPSPGLRLLAPLRGAGSFARPTSPRRGEEKVDRAVCDCPGGGRIIAVGTTVVRALEAAAAHDGTVRAGSGIATGRIGPETELRAVDAILTGVHQPGESHFELLRAFTGEEILREMSAVLRKHSYRAHEFGDSVLIERRALR